MNPTPSRPPGASDLTSTSTPSPASTPGDAPPAAPSDAPSRVGPQRLLLLLLAVASMLTTALLVVNVYLRHQRRAALPSGLVASDGVPINPAGHRGAPPVLHALPEFELIERSEKRVSLADLRGKAWIAVFTFTACKGACPAMQARMLELQSELQSTPGWPRTLLVNLSVDPENDTPAVMRERARRLGADDEHWLWLTAQSRDVMWKLAEEGFRLGVRPDPDNRLMPINHSQRFVLVDPLGRIRGYYELSSGQADAQLAEQARLLSDLRAVLAE